MPIFVTLVDGEEISRESPATFDIPELYERALLQPGQFAKVALKFPEDDSAVTAERFWVIVKCRRSNGSYVGEVNNDLLFTKNHGISCGQNIGFEARHVLAILPNKRN